MGRCIDEEGAVVVGCELEGSRGDKVEVWFSVSRFTLLLLVDKGGETGKLNRVENSEIGGSEMCSTCGCFCCCSVDDIGWIKERERKRQKGMGPPLSFFSAKSPNSDNGGGPQSHHLPFELRCLESKAVSIHISRFIDDSHIESLTAANSAASV